MQLRVIAYEHGDVIALHALHVFDELNCLFHHRRAGLFFSLGPFAATGGLAGLRPGSRRHQGLAGSRKRRGRIPGTWLASCIPQRPRNHAGHGPEHQGCVNDERREQHYGSAV